MTHSVHSSIIYNKLKLNNTHISLNRGMGRENVVHYTMEYSAIKNNDFMKFVGKWLELEIIILSVVKKEHLWHVLTDKWSLANK